MVKSRDLRKHKKKMSREDVFYSKVNVPFSWEIKPGVSKATRYQQESLEWGSIPKLKTPPSKFGLKKGCTVDVGSKNKNKQTKMKMRNFCATFSCKYFYNVDTANNYLVILCRSYDEVVRKGHASKGGTKREQKLH